MIYALHYPFIIDFKKFIDAGLSVIPLPVTVLNIFEHLLILAVSVLLAVGVTKLLGKICPKCLEIITGGRTKASDKKAGC